MNSHNKVWNHTLSWRVRMVSSINDSFNYEYTIQEQSPCDVQYSLIKRWIFYDSSRYYSIETFRNIICYNMTSTNHYHIYGTVTLYFIILLLLCHFCLFFYKHMPYSVVPSHIWVVSSPKNWSIFFINTKLKVLLIVYTPRPNKDKPITTMVQVKLHAEHHIGARLEPSEPLEPSSTASDRGATFHKDDYSPTHIYKSDVASPQDTIHFYHV